MGAVLGMLGLIAFIVAVIGIAAGITWSVVKLDQFIRRARQSSPPAPG